MTTFTKIVGSVLDYEEDWTAWLGSDTIASSSWSVDDSEDIVIDSDSNTTTSAIVWLSAGTLGEKYEVTNTIVTAAGRTDSRTIKVTITEKKYD